MGFNVKCHVTCVADVQVARNKVNLNGSSASDNSVVEAEISEASSRLGEPFRMFTSDARTGLSCQEWLGACYAWIIEELRLNPATDIDKIIENVESQLLQSDLRDSMVHGTGLPANISELDNTSLHGPPVLVEIISMTEIGHSAFSLQNTRQTRIDASDLAVLAADDTGEGDGSIPNYPRAMLRFELSDGSVTFQAMEYRTLPEIQLGVTPLGYKVRCLAFTNLRAS
jgi:RecQ-mediated genome instability protein 1